MEDYAAQAAGPKAAAEATAVDLVGVGGNPQSIRQIAEQIQKDEKKQKLKKVCGELDEHEQYFEKQKEEYSTKTKQERKRQKKRQERNKEAEKRFTSRRRTKNKHRYQQKDRRSRSSSRTPRRGRRQSRTSE